ncbi:hypothetical protein F5Y16DRAFT_423212 [Xylariaceae sp. FL0255]|nr:hypothetical protein F5Y16DRAFT_423212 [Xylariaceae sp. FL0255]
MPCRMLPSENHSLLPSLLGLGLPSQRDVVFIAIDIEGVEQIKVDGNGQVGVAILDPMKLDISTAAKNIIVTHNFTCGSDEYSRDASKEFLFGRSKPRTSSSSVIRSVKALIPTDREVIYVGHGIGGDLSALDAMGVTFNDYNITTIDTEKLGASIYNKRHKLGALLDELMCPYSNLHCAGNDANFALRAMLLLALKIESNANGLDLGDARVKLIKAIAYDERGMSIPKPFERNMATWRS